MSNKLRFNRGKVDHKFAQLPILNQPKFEMLHVTF